MSPFPFVDLEKTGPGGLIMLVGKMRLWLVVGLVCGLVVGTALVFLMPRVYRSSTSFVSAAQLEDRGSRMGPLASAVSTFGLDLSGGGGDLSPLFPRILESRSLGKRILLGFYNDRDGRERVLLDVLAPAGGDSTTRLEEAFGRLHNGVLRHRFDKLSGVTTLEVELEDPRLAQSVAAAFVDGLDAFNRQAKRGQAAEQVDFLTRRIAELRAEFEKSEIALRDFRESNRSLGGSPQLLMVESRLQRDLQLKQEIYLSLRTRLELTSLEANKDTPLVALIDPASFPVKPSAPRPARLVAVGGFLGIVLGFLLILATNQVTLWRSRLSGAEGDLDR